MFGEVESIVCCIRFLIVLYIMTCFLPSVLHFLFRDNFYTTMACGSLEVEEPTFDIIAVHQSDSQIQGLKSRNEGFIFSIGEQEKELSNQGKFIRVRVKADPSLACFISSVRC
jgi:hypothetical protein